ncbi:MAG: extracellular solute-binding protein [Bifidobacteriaceae bacterium]|jgi:raffinose/stachyose/melibiose transport system substrate-binding protein|nr:extracellular solute-binding protein [Bifidobacteriaceae bacterium]
MGHDHGRRTNRRILAVGLAGSLAGVTLAGCSLPGSSSKPATTTTTSSNSVQITAPLTPEDVAKDGTVTLSVWADAGEEKTLADYVPRFETKFPNVKVKLTVKGFDDLVKTVANALNSETSPDVVQGNQGFGVDGLLVKARLIRPLDDLAQTYGWDKYPSSAIAPFRWNAEGTVFGQGSLYGISPVTQNVGVFYNRTLLADAGVQPPQTFADFEAALPVLKKKGITPIVIGNADKYPGVQVYTTIAGALSGVQPLLGWIGGTAGASIDTPEMRQAATVLTQWAKAGYLGEGFNGVSADDAAAKFAGGGGAFYIAGDWNIPTLLAGGQDIGLMAPPTGKDAKHVAAGSLGMGWHISARTAHVRAAAAFIAGLQDPAYAPELVAQGRVPITSPDIASEDPLLADDIAMSQKLMADDGIVGFIDWATDTMYDESGDRLQELLDGRLSAEQFIAALQTNWERAH